MVSLAGAASKMNVDSGNLNSAILSSIRST
ncbi:hypothetical protein SAMN06298226_2812 [Nitrosovibrio sp. Nv4]|nr:hypothetical protein SAMN06298226_2812 [Nitrosovibrio sp. Nv4]